MMENRNSDFAIDINNKSSNNDTNDTENIKKDSCLLPCDIARDILPLYAEGLTSETTAEAIRLHLKECRACSEALAAMSDGDNSIAAAIENDIAYDLNDGVKLQEKSESKTTDTAEIDYLKKVRKKGLITAAVFAAVAALLLCGFWYIKFFLYSGTTDAASLNYTVDVDGNVITFSGSAKDSSTAVSDVIFDCQNGKVVISAKKEPKVFWNSRDFFDTFVVVGDLNEIWVGDTIVWEYGQWIDPDVSRLYAAKTPYIGDISAIGKVASAVGVPYHYGAFTNELQTSEEPYGWTIKMSEPLKTEEINMTQYVKMMKCDAVLLIALIDNLGYVTWEYNFYDGHVTDGVSGAKNDEKALIGDTLTVTEEEASKMTGMDIKSCAGSARQLNSVLNKLQY